VSREDGHGLLCPACGSGRLYVKDTRSTTGYVRRRRNCKDCGARATSYEVIEQMGDPAGTKIGDIMQLREQMMKLTPATRVLVRRLIVKLTEGGTEPPPKTADPVPLTPPPDDIPEEETLP
jgi:hypothetical protein